MLVDRRNTSRTTLSRSLKRSTFRLTGRRLLHPIELPCYLPVHLECHTLTPNMIALQLSDADTSILQRPAHFHIPLTSVHLVADNAARALASSATGKLTFNDEEEDIVICNGWTPEEETKQQCDTQIIDQCDTQIIDQCDS